ncbi:MAG: CoA transferase [Myxococcota bacterium]|nr:CoA transferase [Myxococcota bacterium]
MSDTTRPGALEGIRVLDLSTPLAEATGRVLADLGAEVIKVEPPGGCEARFTAPFENGREGDAEGSLFWRAYGVGKKSVVLDIDDAGDRAKLVELVRGADILVESSTPGEMQARGLDYETLKAENPTLLYVSVTPFGQSGPDAKAPATDLTLSAAGGLMNLQGDKDRPPVPVGYPDASHHGAVQAAADVCSALYSRNRDGQGQHLDVSCQAAVMWTLLFATGYPILADEDQPGSGEKRAEKQELLPGVVVPDRAHCKDGFVVMTLVLGDVGAKSWGSMMRWASEDGAIDEDLAQHDWTNMFDLLMGGKISPPDIQRAYDQFVAFLGTKTKVEIQQRALEGKWLLGPVWSTADLLGDPQLIARDYFTDVGGDTHPGPFIRMSKTPITLKPAARLGEHQAIVEGLASEARKPDVPETASATPRTNIFEGLKVADFAWVAALPLTSKDLANLGATVVKVESEKFVDPLRMLPPWKDMVPNVSNGWTAADYNQSKLCLALDLSLEEARKVALDLVDWADVVTESFTAGSAARLGLDYETLRKRKPELIMVSSCMRGQTGPEASYTGFGLQGAGLAGIVGLTGWPDRLPSGPWGAYTDFISPRFSLAALAAALRHRDRTGEGQYIDQSQIETAMQFISPAVLEYTVNGKIVSLRGHDSERACPHAVFRAEGNQRFVAIAAETTAQWHALRERVPGLDAFGGSEFDSLATRIAHKAELEAKVDAWCATQEPFALAEGLRRDGVPANVVMRSSDLLEDPQLAAREYFVELEHSALGSVKLDGPVTKFSGTPCIPRHAGPTIGEQTFEVLTELLGYDDERVADLAAAGALT